MFHREVVVYNDHEFATGRTLTLLQVGLLVNFHVPVCLLFFPV